MKKLLTISFISVCGFASLGQPIITNNKNTASDTMSFTSDPIMTSYTDSSQFSAYGFVPEETDQPGKGNKKRFKRSASSSSSKSSRRTSASNRRR